ncbi:MAG: PorP/SprF family type IX secretion system membrane protein [Bacteroidales bacterium]|nr:PorP/SprF family type IX secretion system membrane protein [Bacteroidales bacterium]
MRIKVYHFIKAHFTAVFFFICGLLSAQDIHFSQFWMNPIAINPATAGFFEGEARIGIYNRSQWYTVTKAYQTNGLWFDLPIVKRASHQDIFGFGMTFDYDCAGSSKYTTLQSNAMFSYARALNRKNNNFLMIGISGGVAHRSINYQFLSFDEQFQDNIYRSDNPISETFPISSFVFPDCGVGVQWFYHPLESFYYQLGISTFHLNRPYQSLLKDKSIRMPIKYNIQFTTGIGVHSAMMLIPSILFSQQGKYNEIMLGCLYSYVIGIDNSGDLQKFELGFDYRWKDALYVVIGYELRRLRFNFSYDFNLSKLSPASDAQGGIEVSMYYVFKKKKTFKRQDVPCPIW